MSHSITELDIQRCVDGELSLAAQQHLLARLEESEDGWRDLALAYVENQVVGGGCGLLLQELRGDEIASNQALPRSALSAPAAPSRRRSWLKTGGGLLASAAVGVMVGAALRGEHPRSEIPIADARPVTAPDASNESIDPPAGDVVPEASDPQPVLNVEFADASGDASNWLLPVYAAEDLGIDYWQVQDVLPAEVQQALARRGYRLDHQRQFYSIPLDDGREIAVPVDTLEVRYSGL